MGLRTSPRPGLEWLFASPRTRLASDLAQDSKGLGLRPGLEGSEGLGPRFDRPPASCLAKGSNGTWALPRGRPAENFKLQGLGASLITASVALFLANVPPPFATSPPPHPYPLAPPRPIALHALTIEALRSFGSWAGCGRGGGTVETRAGARAARRAARWAGLA
eukprot:9474895-Pyramimonas_sp.AAC.3